MPGDLIRTMKFAPGDSVRLGEGVVWRDPSCAYREGEKGATILRLDKGREIWRDTGPLALLRASDTSEGYVRPRLLDQIRETGYRNNAVSLSVYGMRTDLKMKVFEWRRETLSFPLELIEGTAEYRLAVTWMDQAEKARLQFSYAVKSAYPRGGQGNKNALAGCIAYAERGFWATLRPKYAALLRDLAELKTGDIPGRETLRLKWKEVVENAAWRAFDTAVGDYDTDNHALERLTRARRQLDAALHRLFETAAEKQEREAKSKTKARGKKNAADNAEGVNYE